MKRNLKKILKRFSILLLIAIVCTACSSTYVEPDNTEPKEDQSILFEKEETLTQNDESGKEEISGTVETVIEEAKEESSTVTEPELIEREESVKDDDSKTSETVIEEVKEESNNITESEQTEKEETAKDDDSKTSETVIEEVKEESSTETEPEPTEKEETVKEYNKDAKQENTTSNKIDSSIEEVINSTFSIHFIDVGQADAALVECDGHYMLIDGGNKGDSNKIYSILKNKKIPYLDIVIASHAHEDHVGGLPGAFNYTTSKLTLCPVKSYDSDAFNDFKKYADKNGNGITIPSVGDKYNLGSSVINILGVNSGNDANNSSIILLIEYGDTSFLFTGDAEREAEQVVLESKADISATLLKIGHHGSDTSTTYPFLREIMPEYAIISVGKDNSYGHPTEDTLSRLRDADVKVFRTDLQGDIYCESDGKTITLSVTRNSDIDTLTNPKTVTNNNNKQDQAQTSEKQDSSDTQNKTDYILNTNTKKFHYPSCSSVKRMSDKNKGYHTGTREELISMGYDPCGNCNP